MVHQSDRPPRRNPAQRVRGSAPYLPRQILHQHVCQRADVVQQLEIFREDVERQRAGNGSSILVGQEEETSELESKRLTDAYLLSLTMGLTTISITILGLSTEIRLSVDPYFKEIWTSRTLADPLPRSGGQAAMSSCHVLLPPR